MSQAHVDALLEAREKIHSEEKIHVCAALPESEAGYEIRNYIVDSIEPHNTVAVWLCLCCGVAPELLTDATMRDYRIRWIGWMLETWKDAP